jgi:hypothetical protein
MMPRCRSSQRSALTHALAKNGCVVPASAVPAWAEQNENIGFYHIPHTHHQKPCSPEILCGLKGAIAMTKVHRFQVLLLSTVIVAGLCELATLPAIAETQKDQPESLTNEARCIRPQSAADYGSGATIKTDWYQQGGLGGGVGVFVGHPNTLARSDRALLRFNLAPLFLMPEKTLAHQRAILRFSVSNFAGKADERKIEVVRLSYDPWNLTGNDLVNAKAEVVGTVTADRKKYPGQVYSIDVTQWVQEHLRQGNKFCAFRFRDVEAEAHGNPDIAAQGVAILFNATTPVLELDELQLDEMK